MSFVMSTRVQPYIAVSCHRLRLCILEHTLCFIVPDSCWLRDDILVLIMCFTYIHVGRKLLMCLPDGSF